MCSWHQKPALTTSNNSSKPSARLDAPFDKPPSFPSPSSPFKLQGPERRIDRCTHAPLVSTVVLNMWSTSRLYSSLFASTGKIKGGRKSRGNNSPQEKNSAFNKAIVRFMLRHSDTSLFIRYLRRLHTSGSFRLISFFKKNLKESLRKRIEILIEKKEEEKKNGKIYRGAGK